VLPLFDLPRERAKPTIATARQLGLKVETATDDQMAVVLETAGKLGLGIGILDAGDLGDKMH
jgi:H+-transporting ATPase